MANPVLRLNFHGQVIDHLGIQMYQSPVAAVAELISNAWDSDAGSVEITLPEQMGPNSEIVIKDDGLGMTPQECTEKYLMVGRNRRGDDPNSRSETKLRPLLGRKGIGKFAGFGIAQKLLIETISSKTGERTVFELDLDQVRGNEYLGHGLDIPSLAYDPPDEDRKSDSGTTIHLRGLTLSRTPNKEIFALSMARRFLIHKRSDDFSVKVNGDELPEEADLEGVDFVFPEAYQDGEIPEGLTVSNGWGIENVDGNQIKWQIRFYEKPIGIEELRGISIFSHGKVAQTPFLFNIAGGVSGQHGQEYVSGQIEADYIDEIPTDIIATDRQQINWEHPTSTPLLVWGQTKVKELFKLWQKRRKADRIKAMENKVSRFSDRLENLQPHESKTVKQALNKLASVDMPVDQFVEVGEGVLTAWEEGRLKELIHSISEEDELNEKELLNILLEADLMTALNTAEVIKTKIEIISGLESRIQRKELENAVRNYIAKKPWLVSPEWETFKVEKSVNAFLAEAADRAKLTADEFQGRIDLGLVSGNQLLVLEFMKPGLTINWDHIGRYERYVRIIRADIASNTGGQIQTVTGYLVADNLERHADINSKLASLQNDRMYALDWNTLLRQAKSQWREFFDIVIKRSPQDPRLTALSEGSIEMDEELEDQMKKMSGDAD